MDISDINLGSIIKSGISFGINTYMDHNAKKTCGRVLTAQFQKLMDQGYLSAIDDGGFQLTNKALEEKIGLTAYPDVQGFMQIMNFNEEKTALVAGTCLQIWMNKKFQPWDKRVGNAWPESAEFAKFMRQRATDACNIW